MNNTQVTDDRFLFGAAVGTGMTAMAAERGGADFLLILNAGRLRLQGASSLSCYLPLRSSNDWVIEIAEKEVLNRCSLPVFMGASVCDPSSSVDSIVGKAIDAGFSGMVNFPSAWAIDGRLRLALEAEELGFGRECALIEEAAKAGLSTLAYVTNMQDAVRMSDAGAEMLCVVVGFTAGPTGVETSLSFEAVAETVDDTLRQVPKHVRTLVEGGPITTPEDALAVSRLCRVGGYIAGSTIDRLPLEETIEQVVKSYKVISQLVTPEFGVPAYHKFDGQSDAISEIRSQAETAAHSRIPVLITGSSGTGKTLLAQQIHSMGAFSARNPVIINCNSLVAEDAPEFLFGRAAGHRSRGSAASGGVLERTGHTTLILDEVGNLDAVTQGMLLEFIDTGTVQRLGSSMACQMDTRIISTSNQNLAKMVDCGSFRQDLFYRLTAHHIAIPALAERTEDIVPLAEALLLETEKRRGMRLSNSSYTALLAYSWPGNVRELRNAIMRAAATANGKLLIAKDFAFIGQPITKLESAGKSTGNKLAANIPIQTSNKDESMSERDWIAAALRRHRYRKNDTASELGITPRTLYNKIKKYGLN